MSTQVTATPDQQQAVLKVVAEFQEALLPARLADTNANGVVIAAALSKRGLSFTVENLIHVVNELLFSDVLTWSVEPKKLQAQRHEKPAKIDNPLKLEEQRTAKIKAVEAASQRAAADAASIKQARSMIYSYAPTKRNGFDARERDDRQKFWNAALDAEIANKGNMQDFVTALSAAIEARYKAREKAAERL